MSAKGKVLVIEDDPDGRRSVVEAITEAGYEVEAAAHGAAGIALAREGEFDTVLADLVLPDMDGLKVLAELRSVKPAVPVLIMTAYGSVSTAVQALKAGAYDYLTKPLDLDDLQAKVARAVEACRLRSQLAELRSAVRTQYSARRALVGGSAVMQALIRQIEAVADTTATVLVLGESGTGKELVARALHWDSRRANGPFVAVNCGAFTESLLASELFGHERGAFTGAISRHAGAFERAHGGTLFLDEIGIAPAAVQARLLRALEQKEITRVGGSDPIKVDVRIVAASNRNLEDLVAEGQFRRDLLFRLQVLTLRVPPLRERREDIPALTRHFVALACEEHGRRIEGIEPAALEKLMSYEWPGNVRELRNVVESAVILAPKPVLTPEDLRLGGVGLPERARLVIPPGLTLAELEREALLQALRRNDGNRQMTADELGISARTVQRKIREYDLPF